MKNVKVCVICGKHFTGRGTAITCSIECSNIRHAQMQVKWNKRNRHSPPLEPIPCAVCGEIYLPTTRNQRYCSKKCQNKAHNESKKRWARATYDPHPREPKLYVPTRRAEHAENAERAMAFVTATTEYIQRTCERCSRPRAEGSRLCKYHIKRQEKYHERQRQQIRGMRNSAKQISRKESHAGRQEI